MSRRVKISLETANTGTHYVVASATDIYAANERIKTFMDAKVREYKRKETASVLDARNLVLTR